jgi:uncharacterized phage infection (PIP) family protein YhgE
MAQQFIKHVGKVGDRKVAIVFREIPDEPHMALVVYTQLLNQNIHDPLIAAIEGPAGQKAANLADELNRTYTRDGKIILQVLHHEGMLKKVSTEQIVMTPTTNPKQHIRLNELNTMLTEMEKGEAAVKRLQEIDESRGLQDPKDVARRMRGDPPKVPPAPLQASSSDALGDQTLANNLRQQAIRMATEAKGLLAESDRLIKEAQQLDGTINTVAEPAKAKKPRAKKATVTG